MTTKPNPERDRVIASVIDPDRRAFWAKEWDRDPVGTRKDLDTLAAILAKPVDPADMADYTRSVLAAGKPGPTVFASPTRRTGEVGERNPLVAAAHASRPGVAARAAARADAPTLFSAGDLPDFTASGIDPNVLLRVPWNARQSLAANPDQAEVYAAVEAFNGLGAEDAEYMARDLGLQGPAVDLYRANVDKWLADALTEAEVFAAVGYDDAGQNGTLPNPSRSDEWLDA